MKLFIASSKYFYDRIPPIKDRLKELGHLVALPNSYDDPFAEEHMKMIGPVEHAQWKRDMLRRDKDNIRPNDGILVLNFEKNGQPNYIGGATFLEIYTAFELERLIFLYNPVPENIFRDELLGMQPIVIDRDLTRIRRQN